MTCQGITWILRELKSLGVLRSNTFTTSAYGRKIARRLALQNGYKIIKARWIDINRGDDDSPNYRSRFVAKEFNTGDQDGLFASTPPIEALRLIVHDAATISKGIHKNIMINYV